MESSPPNDVPATAAGASVNRRKDIRPPIKVATVLLLCLVNMTYYMDRFSIAGILIDIQCHFDVGDSEGGLLQSAFILSYVIFAPLTGYLGDRYSRKWILSVGFLLWSALALAATFMESFWSFLALRALLGIGEASFSTIAPALIGDLYAKNERTRYLALYYFTIPVGSGLGFIVSSEVSKAAESWRWGLRVTPILGIVAVLLVILILHDPERGHSEGQNAAENTSWSADMKYLCHHWTFVTMVVGSTAVAFVAGSFGAWGPKLITLGLTAYYQGGNSALSANLDTVSMIFGVITVVAGILGVVIGSLMGQKLRVRHPTADPVICGVGLLLSTPLIYGTMVLARGPEIPTYIIFFFGQWLLNLNWAITGDIMVYVIYPKRRATAKAIQLVFNHVLGDAGSPLVIGLVSDAINNLLQSDSTRSDRLLGDGDLPELGNDCGATVIDPATAERDFQALQYALFMAVFIEVVAAFFYLAASWKIVRDKRRVDRLAVRCFPMKMTHQ